MLTLLRSERVLRFGFKPTLFMALLMPALLLVFGAITAHLGADPQKTIVHTTGAWALRCLWLTLMVTPLRRVLVWPQLLRLRRMLGLFVFFYAVLHLSAYYLLYLEQDWRNVFEDLVERPYITLGAAGFLLLLPLVLTSTQSAMRRLGRRWTLLHKLIYLIALLVQIHFWWQVKSDVREPLIYALVLSSLLGLRLYWWWRSRSKRIATANSVNCNPLASELRPLTVSNKALHHSRQS